MIQKSKTGYVLHIKLIPNSSRNEIIIENNEDIKIKVTAQPIENKANKALVEYLSETFKIAKTKINLIKGNTSKNKTLLFDITEQEYKELMTHLENRRVINEK